MINLIFKYIVGYVKPEIIYYKRPYNKKIELSVMLFISIWVKIEKICLINGYLSLLIFIIIYRMFQYWLVQAVINWESILNLLEIYKQDKNWLYGNLVSFLFAWNTFIKDKDSKVSSNNFFWCSKRRKRDFKINS